MQVKLFLLGDHWEFRLFGGCCLRGRGCSRVDLREKIEQRGETVVREHDADVVYACRQLQSVLLQVALKGDVDLVPWLLEVAAGFHTFEVLEVVEMLEEASVDLREVFLSWRSRT